LHVNNFFRNTTLNKKEKSLALDSSEFLLQTASQIRYFFDNQNTNILYIYNKKYFYQQVCSKAYSIIVQQKKSRFAACKSKNLFIKQSNQTQKKHTSFLKKAKFVLIH